MRRCNSKVCYCNITYNCNNWCDHCISYNVKKHTLREVTLSDFEFFAEHFDMGSDDVWTISGGEPTLSSELERIISFCYQFSHHINMYSNGRLLKKLPADCLDKIERVIVPLYGNDVVHNKYVNAPKAYNETMESLQRIVRYNNQKIDIKILYQSDKNTESIFESPEWAFLQKNEHFSITRVIQPDQNLQGLRDIVGRAERAISMLLDMGKTVRFYDLPVCMMSKELQKRLKQCCVVEHHFDTQVICCSSEHRYKLFPFAQSTDILEACKKCQLQSICSMIMKNYFCPAVNGNIINRSTE